MARTYKRDSRGRFAGGGGGSSGGRGGRPATKRVQRGTNRLTRDNSGKITGQGGSGATARGGRLKTAAGNQRATQLDRLKGRIAGTVGKGGKLKGSLATASAQRKPVTGADLSRRLQRAMSSDVYQRRYRDYERSRGNKSLFKKAENARRTFEGRTHFAETMAAARGLRYRSAASSPEGQARIAVNYSKRPRYSTKQKIRPNWGKIRPSR